MKGICYMHISVLENPELFAKGMSLVSAERREKVQKLKKLKNPMPARLSLAAWILLVFAMEKCGLGDRRDDIKYQVQGKPYLECSDFYFSLSHSGEYAVCAYGDVPLGADIQKIKETLPTHTKKILSEEETAYLNSMSEQERRKAFYQIWARKESLIKWDGRGLRIPLHTISCVKDGQMAEQIDFEGKRLFFGDWDIPEYAFSLCSEKEFQIDEITEVTTKILTKY